ncbi:ABC transporter permease [Enterococcus sp. RIT-PI-f]|uniref:ABC transporter permease n=1 Tax=Enterococcus sp. RIT-PI-f TaxID=1690244 RepID=UPI0006B8F86F|nr:ABC transporter permease [Enterococcus sp. RIT-PI-f]KPG72018.1 hypothetical protein AEQ18_02940 [Enterococcus sp. RIT-PI-f]
MSQLIKADMYRLSKSKIIYVVVLLEMFAVLLAVQILSTENRLSLLHNLLINGTIFLPMLFIPIYVLIWQNDFVNRTINSVLISGLSRQRYYVSKVAITFIMGILFVMIYSCFSFVYTLILQGNVDFPGFVRIVGVQTVLYLVVLVIGLFFFSLENSAALSTASYVLFVLLGEDIANIFLGHFGINTQRLSQYYLFKNLALVAQVDAISQTQLVKMLVSGFVVLCFIGIGTIIMVQKKELK